MSEAPDWWTERGERDEAQRLASRLRHFIADSRLMAPSELRFLESAQITLEAHRPAQEARLRAALTSMVYETTHMSPLNDDGSHDCRISAATLNVAREALRT